MPPEGSVHWLKIDGLGLGAWRVEHGAADGTITLRPVPLNSLTNEELIGQTGYIDWRVQ